MPNMAINEDEDAMIEMNEHPENFAAAEPLLPPSDSRRSSVASTTTPAPPKQKVYEIKINSPNVGREFKRNTICTSQYSVLTFVPKNLLRQFSKASNIYFLLLMLL